MVAYIFFLFFFFISVNQQASGAGTVDHLYRLKQLRGPFLKGDATKLNWEELITSTAPLTLTQQGSFGETSDPQGKIHEGVSEGGFSFREVYREVFASVIYSKCRWFPSDSEFTRLVSEKCGQLRGTLLGVGRFLNEPHASEISSDIFLDHGHLRFVDFKTQCDFD